MIKGHNEIEGTGVSDAVKSMEDVINSWNRERLANSVLVNGLEIHNKTYGSVWLRCPKRRTTLRRVVAGLKNVDSNQLIDFFLKKK